MSKPDSSTISINRGIGARELQFVTAGDSKGHRHTLCNSQCRIARRRAASVEIIPFCFTGKLAGAEFTTRGDMLSNCEMYQGG